MSSTPVSPTDPTLVSTRRTLSTHTACRDRCVSVEHVRGGAVPVLRLVFRTGVELVVVCDGEPGERVGPGVELLDGAVADDGTGHLTFATHPGVVTVEFSKLRAL